MNPCSACLQCVRCFRSFRMWGSQVPETPVKDRTCGSLSLLSRFKPDLGLFRTFGVDLSTSPGCGCIRPSPCVGPVGIEPTWTRCKVKRLNHYAKQVPCQRNFVLFRRKQRRALLPALSYAARGWTLLLCVFKISNKVTCCGRIFDDCRCCRFQHFEQIALSWRVC